jgi:hypothetical protein
MATKTWVGAGANELWNTALNWSGGTIPVAGDDIIFDGVALNGKKNCTLNISFTALSVTFTSGYSDTTISPFNGTFTFSGNLNIQAGGLTLGVNTTYLTSGTPTSFTVTFQPAAATTATLISNGKTIPTNIQLNNAGSATVQLNGNANFSGNFTSTAISHNLRASTGTTVDLRIGGNIAIAATINNATDHVTIKGYGVATKTISFGGTNTRISIASGGVYTSLGNCSCVGASFLTVETGGIFSPNPVHTFGSSSGTVTLSGFNSSNTSDFFGITNGSIILSNDTLVKSQILISLALTIASTGSAKLLLEGNLASTSTPVVIIDRLEFSGTTASIVSATSQPTTLQIKEFIINKTGAGSVTFTPSSTTNPFTLYIPSLQTYSWTHTSGAITQSGNSVIQINGQTTTAIFSYSTAFPTFKFSNLQIRAGKINCISELKCVYLKLYMSGSVEFTSPALLGFTTDTFVAINSTNGALTIILKSLATYSILTELTMFGNLVAGTLAINASTLSPSTRAKFNLETTAQQTVEAVNTNSIDSSGTNNVLPFSKQLIYSLNGVLTSTINWSNTVQPPPVAAKITVGYAFVN